MYLLLMTLLMSIQMKAYKKLFYIPIGTAVTNFDGKKIETTMLDAMDEPEPYAYV